MSSNTSITKSMTQREIERERERGEEERESMTLQKFITLHLEEYNRQTLPSCGLHDSRIFIALQIFSWTNAERALLGIAHSTAFPRILPAYTTYTVRNYRAYVEQRGKEGIRIILSQ